MCYISYLAKQVAMTKEKGLPVLAGRKGTSTSTRRKEA
jgi:hypothetical protein